MSKAQKIVILALGVLFGVLLAYGVYSGDIASLLRNAESFCPS